MKFTIVASVAALAFAGHAAGKSGVAIRLKATPPELFSPCLKNPCPSGKGCAELQPACLVGPCFPEVKCI
ncbi:hypothetical protein DL89DRAFT_268090 [Linderina pennispora]|uniref:Uncharacterized protein n=1 Tax=Linderina pennispora TaxID=61395 RepID=A0A1Y1W6M3_9FUNG|nr:uncharacterized protein DL89DRAFT_268090 [Linderina pennispora]ORX69062.1 hypothetical protein DL89DRAFT_268090 [Linderina pennispora]